MTPIFKINKRLSKLEIVQASFLMMIPLILMLSTGEVRGSISDYAYSSSGNLFVLLLTLAGCIFLTNGVVNAKWYNIVLCFSLWGVALTPHLDYPLLHYGSATVFYVGSQVVMIWFSSPKQRPFKVVLASVIVVAMFFHFYFALFSLLVAEWIGMSPISIHFIGESTGKID